MSILKKVTTTFRSAPFKLVNTEQSQDDSITILRENGFTAVVNTFDHRHSPFVSVILTEDKTGYRFSFTSDEYRTAVLDTDGFYSIADALFDSRDSRTTLDNLLAQINDRTPLSLTTCPL